MGLGDFGAVLINTIGELEQDEEVVLLAEVTIELLVCRDHIQSVNGNHTIKSIGIETGEHGIEEYHHWI